MELHQNTENHELQCILNYLYHWRLEDPLESVAETFFRTHLVTCIMWRRRVDDSEVLRQIIRKTFRTVVIYFAIIIKYAVVIYVAMCCQSLATLGCMQGRIQTDATDASVKIFTRTRIAGQHFIKIYLNIGCLWSKAFKTIYFHRNESKQSYISQNIMKNVNAYKISHFSSCTVSCRDFISPHMSVFSLMHHYYYISVYASLRHVGAGSASLRHVGEKSASVAHRSRVFWPSFPNDTSRKPLFSCLRNVGKWMLTDANSPRSKSFAFDWCISPATRTVSDTFYGRIIMAGGMEHCICISHCMEIFYDLWWLPQSRRN
jgi:hypothetical protein